MAHEKLTEKENFLRSILAPIEPYIMSLQSFLIWEKPHWSAVVLILVHAIFWLSSRLAFYQLIALVGAGVVCLDLLLCQLWARCKSSQVSQSESFTYVHPVLLSVPEISHIGAQWWLWVDVKISYLQRLRQRNWAKFTVLGVLFFSCTWMIGRCVSGIYLAYICWMSILLGPGAVHHKVPQRIRIVLDPVLLDVERRLGIKRQKGKKEELKTVDSEADILREFVPQPTAAAMLPTVTTDTASEGEDNDSIGLSSQVIGADVSDTDDETGSFAQGLNLPSIGDPLTQSDMSLAPSLTQFADETSSQESLAFVSKHFRQSSHDGESDEDKLAEGLAFPDVHDALATENNESSSTAATASSHGTTQQLLEQLQQNIPVATELVQRGAAALVSTAFSGIAAISETVKQTVTASNLNTDTAGSRQTSTAVDEESIDKDFEFLNQEDLVDAEESLGVK